MNINPVCNQTSFGKAPYATIKTVATELTPESSSRICQESSEIWQRLTESPFAGDVFAKVGDGGGSPDRIEFLMMEAQKGP